MVKECIKQKASLSLSSYAQPQTLLKTFLILSLQTLQASSTIWRGDLQTINSNLKTQTSQKLQNTIVTLQVKLLPLPPPFQPLPKNPQYEFTLTNYLDESYIIKQTSITKITIFQDEISQKTSQFQNQTDSSIEYLTGSDLIRSDCSPSKVLFYKQAQQNIFTKPKQNSYINLEIDSSLGTQEGCSSQHFKFYLNRVEESTVKIYSIILFSLQALGNLIRLIRIKINKSYCVRESYFGSFVNMLVYAGYLVLFGIIGFSDFYVGYLLNALNLILAAAAFFLKLASMNMSTPCKSFKFQFHLLITLAVLSCGLMTVILNIVYFYFIGMLLICFFQALHAWFWVKPNISFEFNFLVIGGHVAFQLMIFGTNFNLHQFRLMKVEAITLLILYGLFQVYMILQKVISPRLLLKHPQYADKIRIEKGQGLLADLYRDAIPEDCPICLTSLGIDPITGEETDIADKTLCNHMFHHECLDNWKEVKDTCPLCRTPFDKDMLKHSKREPLI